MRALFSFFVAALVGVGGCGASAVSPTPAESTPGTGAPVCDAKLSAHVYDPGRLKVLNPCMTVTGTVETVPHVSDDGDQTFHLVPDPQFQNLLNSGSNGHLHVEAICQGQIQSDTPQASQSCGAYRGAIAIPPPGTHVSVTGPYVLDQNHGWTEIHPVNVIVRTP